MPTSSSRRYARSAGPGRLTLQEIATLAGCCVQTLRRRIRPKHDPDERAAWARLLDLRKKDIGKHGLVHADAGKVREHLDRIRGLDAPLYPD